MGDNIGVSKKTLSAISKFGKGPKSIIVEDGTNAKHYVELIPIAKLRSVLHNLGGRLTNEEIDMLVTHRNQGSNVVELEHQEFMRVIMFASLVICIYDREGNGNISVQDLSKAMLNFNSTCSEADMYKRVKGVVTSGVNVFYENFIAILKNNNITFIIW